MCIRDSRAAFREENAVPVGLLNQGEAAVDAAQIPQREVGHSDPEEFPEVVDLAPAHPDDAGLAGAAVPALRAGEAKPLAEPGRGHALRILSLSRGFQRSRELARIRGGNPGPRSRSSLEC